MTHLAKITKAPSVCLIDGTPRTTTRQVAERFNKRHDTVLRALENLECSDDYHHLNFAEVSYEVEAGNGAKVSYKEYTLTRDGFAFLCMGFTGKEAAKWKEAYISEFNRMEEMLKARLHDTNLRNFLRQVQSTEVWRIEELLPLHSAISERIKMSYGNPFPAHERIAAAAYAMPQSSAQSVADKAKQLFIDFIGDNRFCMTVDKQGALRLQPVAERALMLPISEWANVIKHTGEVSTKEMIRIMTACAETIGERETARIRLR